MSEIQSLLLNSAVIGTTVSMYVTIQMRVSLVVKKGVDWYSILFWSHNYFLLENHTYFIYITTSGDFKKSQFCNYFKCFLCPFFFFFPQKIKVPSLKNRMDWEYNSFFFLCKISSCTDFIVYCMFWRCVFFHFEKQLLSVPFLCYQIIQY